MNLSERDQVLAALRSASNVVALTGAGVSTASGIPDFRSAKGLWGDNDWTEIASLSAFRRTPDRVWVFYRERLAGMAAVEPNAAHHALAALERSGVVRAVITQNVDGLHRRAGSVCVCEVHGDLERAHCLECGASVERDDLHRRLEQVAGAPLCDCGAPLKPGVVLFEEMLDAAVIGRALTFARSCDLLLCCGTSLEVNPVASLAPMVVEQGGTLVILTEGDTPYDDLAAVRSRAPLHELLPLLHNHLDG